MFPTTGRGAYGAAMKVKPAVAIKGVDRKVGHFSELQGNDLISGFLEEREEGREQNDTCVLTGTSE